MLISLHKQATTTPRIRAAIKVSTEPAWMVAERFGISEQTVWKWRNRDSVEDRSHTSHRLQSTFTPAQKAVAASLRSGTWVAAVSSVPQTILRLHRTSGERPKSPAEFEVD